MANKKSKAICGVVATSIALAAAFGSGCSFVTSDNVADMNQVIATVDISKATLADGYDRYKDSVEETSIIKRELVAYFLNVGYSYVQNYGWTYEQTFNNLVDSLVENAVMVQYSTVYLLKDKAESGDADAVISAYKACPTKVDKYIYLLGGEDSKDVKIAEYALLSSVNSAIDTYERQLLEEEDSSSGTETRATPSNVDTEKEDYYPSDDDGNLDYNIYTGYDGYTLEESGAYQDDKLEGTSMVTRRRAYNSFISSLASNSYNLIGEDENLRKVRDLEYIQSEYATQLEQRIINKYYDIYEKEQEELLKNGKSGEAYGYINDVYNELLGEQRKNNVTESNFTSALSSMSDSSFVLYAPNTTDMADNDIGEAGTYGFVYNILLPFDSVQEIKLSQLQTKYADSALDGGYKPQYYTERATLLDAIETYDQRAPWFNGSEEYAFKTTGVKGTDYYGASDYLFFENNVLNTEKYESLDKYAGEYAYNGTVIKNADDEYILRPNKLNIDDMLDEFVSYVDFYIEHATGNAGSTTSWQKDNNYNQGLYSGEQVNGKDQIDYKYFVYANGKVDLGETDYLNNTSKNYAAISAVNELQYAYTTDTGVLSQYLGYSVNVGDTSYIKEFEYAAQTAIAKGAGNFTVCAGDYGWHLIYVTYAFKPEGGEVFNPDWTKIGTKGTFEDYFYEWIKDNNLSNLSTSARSRVVNRLNTSETVTKYQNRYQDLLDLG